MINILLYLKIDKTPVHILQSKNPQLRPVDNKTGPLLRPVDNKTGLPLRPSIVGP